MGAKFIVRPSRPVSAFSAVVALGMAAFGVYFYLQQRHWFILLWTVVALGAGVFHAINATSHRRGGVGAVEVDQVSGPDVLGRSLDERLRELDDLRKKNLISDEEYSAKRSEVLNDI